MKSAARNTLAYTGNVTLSQYVGSKKVVVGKVHNSGGKPLFDFFISCLTGDFTTANALLPRRIGLFTAKYNTDGSLSEITKKFGTWGLLLPARKVDSTEDNSSVCYSFTIPFEIISPITSFEDAYVGLYSEAETSKEEDMDYGNYMAYFSLSTLNRSLFLNAALAVDWELQVINGKTEYENVSSTK